MYDSIFNHFKSRHRDRDNVVGDVSQRSDFSEIKVYYKSTLFATIGCRLGKKEGFLEKIKKALVKRKRLLHGSH